MTTEHPIFTADKLREWGACYTDDLLRALYDRPMTAIEVLTRADGEWACISSADRVWTLTRPGALPARIQQLFAIECAERAFDRERSAGRVPDQRSVDALDAASKYANAAERAIQVASLVRLIGDNP